MAPSALTSPDQHDPIEAERLKALGNELYERKEYEGAYHKYTLAIEKDPANAILYANRAAVHLARKEYIQMILFLDPPTQRSWRWQIL